jgi:tyrosyl-tRNA synthetase
MDPISEFLTRGVANIIPNRDQLDKILRSGRKLNVYNGIDPTSTHVHLGNALSLRKLQALVDTGHHVTFLIGDFTALIGDTSDKDSERPVLTYQQVETNFQTYKSQAQKILDFSRVTIGHNSDWLKKLNFEDIVKLTRHFSLNDFISRELIKTRLAEGRSVSLPEVLYPVMQGYDSYIMDTDLQIGGTDQTFNMQAGRTLQKNLRHKESFVLSTVFLEGTDGRKMSKSWGNAVWLDDEPNDMYGKIMSVKDELIDQYFLLATNLPQNKFPQDPHPMNRKKKLAWQIVSELHGTEAADTSRKYFETAVQKRTTPASLPVFNFPEPIPVLDALVATGLADSKSEARRLIDQNGIKINSQKISDYNLLLEKSSTISAGTRSHVKVNIGS